MSFAFIFLASFSVAFGTYILSSALSGGSAFVNLLIHQQSKLLVVGIGLSLNLLGSAFWILARRFSASYLLVWTLYLGLLVLFGAVIAAWIEQESISSYQVFGLLLLICALALLKA